ncbi:unnamed protein product [Kluyveromyces dobzhanskii CBS 2104]|uniref:WGS project CCBQ000000000 data, contig 00017 n=1 Tax=Kluyveromyces dobzhanskii CBS 2104 TaxID=1427455 RepID=A0A0A8L6T1_9SACH|nr:unnamed protein product [Kluyveromyces dobzhanskii CBS 2104]
MKQQKNILGKYIAPSVQNEILSSLFEADDYEGINSVISSVQLNEEVSVTAGDILSRKVEAATLQHFNSKDYGEIQKDEQLLSLLKICPKLKHSNRFIGDFLRSSLRSFVLENQSTLFDPRFQRSIEATDFLDKTTAQCGQSLDGKGLLDIIDVLVKGSVQGNSEETITSNVDIAKLLFLLSISKDDQLSVAATSLFKWWTSSFSHACRENAELDTSVWSLVQNVLEQNPSTALAKNSFTFCLRMLMEDGFSPASQMFAESTDFWYLIQYGLSHEVHEIKKIVLSLFKLTLQLAGCNKFAIDTCLIRYAGSKSQLDSWKRFTTLYEIVGIDTALNQCEAAAPDILAIFEDSNIDASWGLIIISTGLKATMESVRKFTLRLMLQVKNKSVFEANPELLREVFLPATLQASFFNVSDDHCEYGGKLAEFIAEIIVVSARKENMILLLLNVLHECRSMFDAGRIYVAYGILRGLEKLRTRVLSFEHIEVIKLLFMTECEENVLQTTNQSIFLKYLLYSNLSAPEFIHTLVIHVRSNNSYEYISRLMDNFRDFVIVNYGQSLEGYEVPADPLYEIFAYELFDIEPYDLSDKFLIEVVKADCNYSQISGEYYSFLSELVSMESDSYHEAKVILDLPQFTPAVYGAINPLPIFSKLLTEFSADKFDFFVALFGKVMESPSALSLTFEEQMNLYTVIVEHVHSKKIASFKYKDEIYSNFFKLVTVCIKSSFLNTEELSHLLEVIKENAENENGNYLGNLEITYLCQSILDVYIVPTVHVLTEDENRVSNDTLKIMCRIWDSLSQERLVLNQQPLHVALIKGIFHYTTFLSALNDASIFDLLLDYGLAILDQSHSRRTFKPTISQEIVNFMEMYGTLLPPQKNSSFVRLLTEVFIHESMNFNIYKLKPVIAKLFDSKLSINIDGGLYEYVYGAEEIFARANIVKALLLSSEQFKCQFLHTMLQEDPNMLKAKKKTDGPEEIQRVSKWQLSLLTIKSVDQDQLTDLCSTYIVPSLLEESSPLVRVYLEWFLAYNICATSTDSYENPMEKVMFQLLEDTSRPVLQTSVERLLFLALKASKETGQYTRLMDKFIEQLIFNCSSNKPLIRHFSNSLILLFFPAFKDDIKDHTLKSIISKLYKDAEKIQVQGRFRAGDANTWSIHNDLNLTSIFGGVLMKIMDHKVPYINSTIFRSIGIDESDFTIGSEESNLWLSKRENSSTNPKDLEKNSPLQTKSGAWEAVLDFDNQKTMESVTRSELIVVASLVDKAPNLGGICRLCDVLGVGTMTIHDIRVKQNSQFKSVAVTADRWMPIEEVPVDGILAYMNAKKLEGYTLIGLEQTDSSLQLDSDFKFPSKSLILLGTEAHGIPGHLLKELDICLEIKQSGVIRSMNIQTATAVIVHSYSIQHL